MVRKQTQAVSDASSTEGIVLEGGGGGGDPSAATTAANTSFNIASFNEELYRRAVDRETELLDKLRALKQEVSVCFRGRIFRAILIMHSLSIYLFAVSY